MEGKGGMEASDQPQALPRQSDDGQVSATADGRAIARDVSLTVGLAAGAVSMLPALISASAAASHQADVLALQRALVTLRDSLGGPWIDPAVDALIPMFIVGYLAPFLGLVATLGLCWYAGYVVQKAMGNLDAATRAGRRVAWLSWLVWFAATMLSVIVLHLDSSLAWVVATAAKLLFTPSTEAIQGMSVAVPDVAFLLIQVVVVLVQVVFGLLLGVYLGGIAAQAGAERGSPFILAVRLNRRHTRTTHTPA